MAEQLRVAVIGAGLMGRAHASAATSNGARVVAVSDENTQNAARLARASDARAMTLDPAFADDVDAVHVCTPPDQHFKTVRNAIAAGKHVLCEKPLAETAAEVRELHAMADAAGVTLCPSHQMPFQRGVQRFLSARQALGTIRHITVELCTAGADTEGDEGRSRILGEILPHPLSVSRAFGANPLPADAWQIVVPSSGELIAVNGAGAIGLSFLLSTRGRPTSHSVRVIADNGTVTLDLFHGYSIFERGTASRIGKLTRPFAGSGLTIANATANGLRRVLERETSFPGLRELVRRFYAAAAGEGPTPITATESIEIAVAREAITTTRDRLG